ncbi:uncharacterized protein LOC122251831 isoform X2 [Penaeus japonicus]|nr:uncharacterized protein LOC122251831 isoform X2 [Penaeus japonicus]
MLALRSVIVAVAVVGVARVGARPQVLDITKVAATGGFGILEAAGRSGGVLSNVASDALATAQTFGEGARDVFRDTFQIGSQGLNRFSHAFRDTTGEMVRGFKDTTRAANSFIANGVRTTGRLAADTVSTGFEVARDTVGAKADFLKDVSRTAVNGAGKVAGAVGNFAEGAIDNTVGFIAPATQIVERVINKGIENFSHVLVPDGF